MAVWSNTSLSEISESFGRLDAEFFRPEYLTNDHLLEKLPLTSLRTVASKIDVGHVGSMVKHYTDDGVLLLQTQNVKEFFLDLNHTINITPAFHDRLNKSKIRRGDILIARSGSFGSAAVYLEDDEINSADIIIVNAPESNGIDPLFLVAFMNSRFGSTQLVRFASGGVQGHVNLKILEHFKIPKISDTNQSEIANLVRLAYSERKTSEGAYTQAQQLLESELGLDKLRFDRPVGYTARFSELELSRRADAEFFNPELRYFQQEIAKHHQLRLITDFVSILKFSNPPYSNVGLPIITQKHLGKISPDNYGDDLVAHDAWVKANPLATIRNYDLLYYSVGAYLGKTNIWLSNDKAVHASFISMLRPSDPEDSGFLHVLLNSKYGILQSKCFQSGTSQPYIYPKDIRRFFIPAVSKPLRLQIHELVIESFSKGEESKQLLDQAKSRVEQLIEEAVRT